MPDKAYTIDGVPVTLERSQGPSHGDMTLATQLYRQEAAERWELLPEDETSTWRGLREIRWTINQVLDDADYDAETGVLSAIWYGCVLHVPFYQALTFHYAGEGLTDEDLVWAKELEVELKPVVCIEDDTSWGF
jgi:hypothetical protein